MTTKEKLFFAIMDGMKATRKFKTNSTEALENNKLKEGYIIRTENNDTVYYRFDEDFIEANRADFEALVHYENAHNIQSIKNWITFFGILTIIGGVIGVGYAIYLFS